MEVRKPRALRCGVTKIPHGLQTGNAVSSAYRQSSWTASFCIRCALSAQLVSVPQRCLRAIYCCPSTEPRAASEGRSICFDSIFDAVSAGTNRCGNSLLGWATGLLGRQSERMQRRVRRTELPGDEHQQSPGVCAGNYCYDEVLVHSLRSVAADSVADTGRHPAPDRQPRSDELTQSSRIGVSIRQSTPLPSAHPPAGSRPS